MKIAILDDYQEIATRIADWGRLPDGIEVVSFSRRLTAEELQSFEIIVAMRERTPFDGRVLRQLPRLRLLVTTGMRNAAIDDEAVIASSENLTAARATELGLMKETSPLINTSRGPIVDESALVGALTEHRIAGAGLDVFDEEPLPADNPFRVLENVIATPHIGYVTEETYRAFYGQAIDDILGYLEGRPLRVLNEGVLGRERPRS